MATIFQELKRRNVVKVGAAYAAVAWLVAQIAETVFPVFDLPEGLLRAVFIVAGLGFPITIVLAWVYDLTPEGIRRTDDMPEGTRRLSGRGLDFTIIGCLSVAVLFLALDRFVWSPPADMNVASIAVLPFKVEQPDLQTSYLGNGIADSLITRLSRLPQIKVKSRSMIGQDENDIQALGERLGVQAVCLGHLVRRGEILEIVVELINVVDGSVMWSNRLQRNLSTLVSIESEVSAEIASALSIELSDDEAAALAKPPTENAEAYRLYLQGRHLWNQRSEEGLRSSADYYRQAVDLDPGYALAWSGLADSYLMLFAWGMEPPKDAAPLALAAAQRAIELDPALAEPYATVGYYKTLFEWDWDGAEAAFLKSIELNEDYGTAHHWYAFYLSTIGDSRGAIEEILVARESEPLSPIINAEVGLFYVYDGQYAKTIEEMKRASLWNPDFPTLLMTLSRAYALSGQHDKASETVDRLKGAFGDNLTGVAFSNMVLPRIGRSDEARLYYEYALAESAGRYVMPGILGVLAAGTGDNDAAFKHFYEGLDEHSLVISWLRDPLIDNLRDDPRYADLFERVGLTP